MSELRRQVGFLGSLGSNELKDLLWPEGAVAVVFGVGGASCLVVWDTVAQRSQVVGEGLAIVGVLIGITFTAFSLLIALLSDDYIRLLEKAEDGILGFLRPFVTAIGLQITVVLLAIAYRAIAMHVTPAAEKTIFIVWSFLFVYVLADILALARNVSMHGLFRARDLLRRDEEESGKIRSIGEKQAGGKGSA